MKRPCIPGGREAGVSTFVPLLDTEQVLRLPAGAREVVEYPKSGLSLNHIQGCPLDCAYCIRHTYGLWDQRQPRALMPDAEAVEQLVSHRYFQAHLTPVQLLNRATDPFLPVAGRTRWRCWPISTAVACATTCLSSRGTG
jgi:DNA repair photolyase